MTEQQEGRTPPLPKALDLAKTACDVRVELLHRILPEVAALSVENAKESPLSGKIAYNPDWGELLKYCIAGKCVLVTARYNDVLVGYTFALLGPFSRNKDIEYAQIEAFYILPTFRDMPTASSMRKLIESELQGRAEFILIGSDPDGSIQKVFGRAGYEPVEVLMYKRLTDVGK